MERYKRAKLASAAVIAVGAIMLMKSADDMIKDTGKSVNAQEILRKDSEYSNLSGKRIELYNDQAEIRKQISEIDTSMTKIRENADKISGFPKETDKVSFLYALSGGAVLLFGGAALFILSLGDKFKRSPRYIGYSDKPI